MLRLIGRLVRLLAAFLVVVLGLYFGGPYLLTAAGWYLITAQPLEKADLILVLSGQPFLRVPEAARLYQDGIAPRILLTSEPRERGLEVLARQGIRFPDSLENALAVLQALRVPRSAILVIPDRSDSTWAEMQAVARFLNANPARTLIIVTSKSHTTRAHKIFAAGLGQGTRLIMRPVVNDPFDPTRWWKDRTDAKAVLHEFQALADFWRLRLWQAARGRLKRA
jgi:uncharacterized SAM-binding protein YcdF (DUF218 family)